MPPIGLYLRMNFLKECANISNDIKLIVQTFMLLTGSPYTSDVLAINIFAPTRLANPNIF